MSKPEPIGRRHFLKAVGGLAALNAMPAVSLAASKGSPTATNPKPDLVLELRAVRDRVAIWAGSTTPVWRYRARVVSGNPESIASLPDSYVGPVIRVRRGMRVRIDFVNELPQPTVVHWHGLIVPEVMDGHPRHAVAPGGRYVYEFEVRNRAGTYWFHPHPHELTGVQVYGGLAGLFIVSDDEEQALNLPSGERDIPLVIQDRSFSQDNQLRYLDDAPGMMGMMGRMSGFLGDHVLVNGRPLTALTLAPQVYRLRLLNGSNSRIYKLAWDDGSPFTVIGTDGGLLASPEQRPYLTLAPAERVELWVDLSRRKRGEELALRSLPLAGASGGMMMGGMRGGFSEEPMRVLSVRVGAGAVVPQPLPHQLARVDPANVKDAENRNDPRRFRLTMGRMRWSINGRIFEMEGVAADEVVRLGTTELWEFSNDASMGMMGGMPHPIHVHGVQFRVVERSVARGAEKSWRDASAGYVDAGWKDTVLLMPGERVRLLVRFDGYPGLFVYHCHNLEHEDMGMMRNFLIKA